MTTTTTTTTTTILANPMKYQGMIAKIARKYHRGNLDMEDLMSEGLLAIVEASQTFDPERGAEFTTHAWYVVRHRIRNYARAMLGACGQIRTRDQRAKFDAGELSVHDVSTDVPAGEDTTETIGDRLADADAIDPEAKAILMESEAIVREHIRNMDNDRDALILTQVLFSDLSIVDIGKAHGITKQRASQIWLRERDVLRRKLAA